MVPVPNPFGTMDWFRGKQLFHGPGLGSRRQSSGGDESEVLLTRLGLCSLAPNRPWPGTGLWPRGQGPLLHGTP